nr:MAG TPA: hypothetical protein [Bacteriophage sp.]
MNEVNDRLSRIYNNMNAVNVIIYSYSILGNF